MFGKANTKDLPALSSHADALAYWESIKPIRNRAEDERPLGDRRKSHIKIARKLDNVVCVLYKTDVITFHPDDTVTISVPEEWRSNTTAAVIASVLRKHIRYMGIQDHDVVVAVNVPTYSSFRVGPATKFKLVPNGLELIEGNIVKETHAVNRKAMNAARADIKEFLTYLRGSHKVREGLYSSDEMSTLQEFLVKHRYTAPTIPIESFMSAGSNWALSLPSTNRWIGSHRHVGAWHERIKFALKMMREGSHEDWYAVSLWLVASSYYLATARNAHVDLSALITDVTDMLLVTVPDALIATPEPYGEIKVDGNRLPAAVKKVLAEMETYE